MLFPVYSSEKQNPFEIETIARQELQRDRLFALLTPEQRESYVSAALAIGAKEAAAYTGQSLWTLAATLGVMVESDDGGNGIAGGTVYAEYDAQFRSIRLHRAGVLHLVSRLRPLFSEDRALEIARELLIAHELFHHLEATRLGPVHRMLPPISVPLVGRLWKVRRYVVRTREIAAHSFAHTLLGLTERSV